MSISRQKRREYDGFTGLPLVCKTIQKEYTATLTRNTTVAVSAEDFSAYIETYYPDRDDALKQGDVLVSYTTFGQPIEEKIDSIAGRESFKLDVSQLLQLQRRLPWMRVSFICYSCSFLVKKPMYWNELTEDFNNLFSATPVHGPTLPGAGPIPSIVPQLVDYFASRTEYELSVNSRWPKPGQPSSNSRYPFGLLFDHLPAIIFNIKFNASESPDLPFSEHWRNTSKLKRIAHPFWNVDEMFEVDEDRIMPHYDEHKMWELLNQTRLCYTGADVWFIRFHREYVALHPEDASSSMISDDQPRIQKASKVNDGGDYSDENYDEEMTQDDDNLPATALQPRPLSFTPFIEKAPFTENGTFEY